MSALVDDVDAVDEYVLDTDGQLVGILEGGAVTDSFRVEDDDIGQHAAAQKTPVARPSSMIECQQVR